METKKRAGQEVPSPIPLEELQTFYALHAAQVLQLPVSMDIAVGEVVPTQGSGPTTFIVGEDVITRDEAKQAFHMVKDNFATMSNEHACMKQGLQGLASEIDAVRGKAIEDHAVWS